MNRVFLTICLIHSSIVLLAQAGSAIPTNMRAVNTIERLTYFNNSYGGNEMMYGIPLPEGKVIGDTYLNQDWRRSAILLYDGDKLLEGYAVRYDILGDELDVKTTKGVKVLDGRKVKSFIWMDSLTRLPAYFINAKAYKNEGAPLSGFFEVLVDGKTPLFRRYEILIKKADYNVQLSVGSRDDKILKKVAYYFPSGDEVFQIPSNRKKLLGLLGDKSGEIENFMETNKLSPKAEEDLIRLFQFYNLKAN